MRDDLEEINRKLTANELDIAPEGQRSPSPEPVYDSMGTRVNTREIRAREKLVEKRHKWVLSMHERGSQGRGGVTCATCRQKESVEVQRSAVWGLQQCKRSAWRVVLVFAC